MEKLSLKAVQASGDVMLMLANEVHQAEMIEDMALRSLLLERP